MQLFGNEIVRMNVCIHIYTYIDIYITKFLVMQLAL
jgi:hypothetical protein